jgi:hypothetical protein
MDYLLTERQRDKNTGLRWWRWQQDWGWLYARCLRNGRLVFNVRAKPVGKPALRGGFRARDGRARKWHWSFVPSYGDF